jgi:hypothetical protein
MNNLKNIINKKINIKAIRLNSSKKYSSRSNSLKINNCPKWNNTCTINNYFIPKIITEFSKLKKKTSNTIKKENVKPKFFLTRKKNPLYTKTKNQNILKKITHKTHQLKISPFFKVDHEETIKSKNSKRLRKRLVQSTYRAVSQSKSKVSRPKSGENKRFKRIVKSLLPSNQLNKNWKKYLKKHKFILKGSFLKRKNKKTKKFKSVYYVPPTKKMKHLYMRKALCLKCKNIKKR